MNHLIQLWPGDWLNQISNMNEAVVIRNFFTIDREEKQLVHTLKRREFWECIGCVILSVTYGKKENKLWSEIPIDFGNMAPTKLRGDVCGNRFI